MTSAKPVKISKRKTKTKKPANRAIARAIEITGTQEALGKLIGLSQPAVNHLLYQSRKIPPKHAIAIEKATKGEVSRGMVRPDLWPRSHKKKAA